MFDAVYCLNIKKIFLLIFVSIFLVSCGLEKGVNESTNTQSSNTVTLNSQDTMNNESQESRIIESEKVLVSSSIIPLSSVINAIGGVYFEVNNIVPAGVSPHGFDLSAKQMVSIENSERVFLTGLEHIDGFLEKAVPENKKIHLADGMKLIESSGHEHHDEDKHSDEDKHEGEDHHEVEHLDDEHSDEEHKGEHDEDTHNTDPHVWLGKENIIKIVKKVQNELTALMPEQAEYFMQNTEKFEQELEKIYNDFESQVAGKTPSEFIVFHDAYNYLMQSIGMDLNLKVAFSENVLHETGTAHMAELIEEVQTHGVKHVFKEPQFRDGNLQKFVTEYDLIIGTLDPLGTDASANGYLDNIRSNLSALINVYE